MKRFYLLIGILTLPFGGIYSQNFAAFVSKNKVALDETFQVSFKLDNAQPQGIEYPAFEGFQVLGGPNISTSMQFVNGSTSQSITYSFYLRPKREGKLTIGPAAITVNNQKLSSQAIQMEVTAAGTASNSNTAGGDTDTQRRDQSLEDQLKDYIFLRAIVSDKDVFLGEQLTVTYKLYERIRALNLVPEEPPKYEGFWVENIDLQGAPAQNEVIDGIQYQTRIIKKDILFPQRAGKLVIDPMTLSCVVQVQSQPRQRRNIFDSFFETYENYPYTFANAAIPLEVKPLPVVGKPADFSGMVGDLDMEVTLDKTEVKTGDAVTFRVKYSGEGNVKNFQEPRLEFPPDFDVFDPKIDESIAKSSGIVSGRRSFDYLIVPRNPGKYKLPVISFSYFDPKKKDYVTLRSSEYMLNVTGEAQRPEVALSNMSKEDMELIGQDIRYIQTDDPHLRKTGQSFAVSLPFFSLYLLPLVIFGLLVYVRKNQRKAAADVEGTRRKKASRIAQKRLEAARKFLTAGEEKNFYKEITHALWGYLGDKLTINPSELLRDNIREKLLANRVEESLIQRLTDLLDSSEMALFAPASAAGGMSGIYDQALQLIADLEDVTGK
ncbi:MAG: BatD family protein [Bacteroidia bacterium]|nr:BatD family protein [Bacteroidia bacterium]